jgi:proline dehydrogenase
MTEPYQPPHINFDDLSGVLGYRTDEELRAANFVLWTIRSSFMMKTGRAFARLGLALRIPGTVPALRSTVFRVFCGGTDLHEAMETTARLHQRGVGSILDYAVEGGKGERDFDGACHEIARVIDATAVRPEIEFVAVKVTGLCRFSLLEKATAGMSLDGHECEELQRAEDRLDELIVRAGQAGISVFVDAEHSWVQGAINDMVERCMRRRNRERAVVSTTVQLYLRGGIPFLRRSIGLAREHGYQLGVKLVRGAYMELERERAAERGLESPVQPDKAATDRAFDQATTICLENIDWVTTCIATHNVASTRHLVAEMARLGIAKDDIRVTASQLLGMFDRVTFPLAEAGYNALKYVPYGGVREAFPYLLRRADENKSVAEQLASELEAVRDEMRRRGLKPL